VVGGEFHHARRTRGHFRCDRGETGIARTVNHEAPATVVSSRDLPEIVEFVNEAIHKIDEHVGGGYQP
jgi:hypothetical protein